MLPTIYNIFNVYFERKYCLQIHKILLKILGTALEK